MRMILLAAALSVGGVAYAQTEMETDAQAEADATVGSPDGTDPNARAVPPGDGITQQGTNPEGRGVAPPGTNEVLTPLPGAVIVPDPNQQAAFTPKPATKDYPVCSKTVTDGCVQAYERGVGPDGS